MTKITLFFLIAFFSMTFFGCNQSQGQNSNLLDTQAFSKKINETKDAQILDVRTANEFAENHLAKAININWNGNDFVEKASFLDKNKPVFVYCLAGGRSASAHQKLKELGFTNIYEMKGGIAKWKANQLPLEQKNTTDKGMNETEFNAIITQKKYVLIDFTAAWCAPCKKLKPILEKIGTDNKNIKIVAIDYDKNTEIVEKYKVDAIPMLMIFEKGKKVWENVGFLSEKQINEKLKELGI